MKGRLLVLTRFPTEYEPKRFKTAGEKKHLAVEVINYSKSDLFNINSFDYLIPRSSAHFRKDSFIKTKVKILNQLPETITCLNKKTYCHWSLLGKLMQSKIMSENGLPVIPMLTKPEFPMILKSVFGSHSRLVFRVNNRKEFDKLMQIYKKEWIYQKLIPTPNYWRVLVLDGKPLGMMKRRTNPKFYAGKEKINTQKNEILSLAKLAAGVFDCDFAGVDLLADRKGKLMVIEVNRSPQFKMFEKKTGIRVAEKVIDFLIN